MHRPPALPPSADFRLRPLLAAVAALLGGPALAATLTVGAGGDGTDSTGCALPANATCTLRGALSVAANGDTIVFAAALSNQTIAFTTDDPASVNVFPGPTALVVDGKSVTLDASGLALPLTLSGNDARRLFYVTATGGLTLKGLHLAQGRALGYDGATVASGGGGGAGAGLGGAILSEGALTIEDATLSGNQVVGGDGGGSGPHFDTGGGGGGTAGEGSSGNPGAGGGGGGGNLSPGLDGSFGGGGGGAGNGNADEGGAGGFGGGGGGGGTDYGAGGAKGWGGGAGGQADGTNGGGGGGGGGLGGALFVKGGSVILRNVVFSGNATTGGNGGAGSINDSGDGETRGGAIFVCAAAEGCAGALDEAASCGVGFSANSAATGQADLYWSAATGGAHVTDGVTDACPTAEARDPAPIPALDNHLLMMLAALLGAAGMLAKRRRRPD